MSEESAEARESPWQARKRKASARLEATCPSCGFRVEIGTAALAESGGEAVCSRCEARFDFERERRKERGEIEESPGEEIADGKSPGRKAPAKAKILPARLAHLRASFHSDEELPEEIFGEEGPEESGEAEGHAAENSADSAESEAPRPTLAEEFAERIGEISEAEPAKKDEAPAAKAWVSERKRAPRAAPLPGLAEGDLAAAEAALAAEKEKSAGEKERLSAETGIVGIRSLEAAPKIGPEESPRIRRGKEEPKEKEPRATGAAPEELAQAGGQGKQGDQSAELPTDSGSDPKAAKHEKPATEISGLSLGKARRGLPWEAAAAAMLCLALSWQSAMVFRDEIGAASPGARALVDAIGAPFGLSSSLGSGRGKAKLITADVAVDDEGFVEFRALAGNDSEKAVEAPRLSLRLESENGEAIGEAVFDPKEWLGSDRLEGGEEREGRLIFAPMGKDPESFKAKLVWPGDSEKGG